MQIARDSVAAFHYTLTDDQNQVIDSSAGRDPLTYDVTFPMFAKIDVNGAKTHPLYKYLKHEAKGLLGSEAIKWNFTKFLVGKDGRVERRYAPTDTPESIAKDVAAAL